MKIVVLAPYRAGDDEVGRRRALLWDFTRTWWERNHPEWPIFTGDSGGSPFDRGACHGHVDVMAVPSNHTAWRQGKQNLGRPSDDLGLQVHRFVEREARAAGYDVSWTFPAQYDESVTLDVNGTIVGMVHGNQFAPGGGALWWGKQTHGGQPVGAADVLISGHYHCFKYESTGRNPYTGRSKRWVQAPTLDNGSDWYRNKAGDDSDPGLLVFDIDADGFNLQSLTVL